MKRSSAAKRIEFDEGHESENLCWLMRSYLRFRAQTNQNTLDVYSIGHPDARSANPGERSTEMCGRDLAECHAGGTAGPET